MSDANDTKAKDAWQRATDLYVSTLPAQDERSQARRHFSMVTSITESNGSYKVYTSNKFAAELLRDTYGAKLKNALILSGGGDTVSLEFLFDESARPSIIVPQPVKEQVAPVEKINHFVSPMPLNEEYTFEEFVTGPSNSWAHAAAKGAAKEPGKKGYNPLFIHGGTGLGKTHLMEAIGHYVLKRNPSSSVCFITSETFLNEYVNAIANNAMQAFRDRYRKVDLLLMDDVQFIAGKKQFQEEFFNTFNSLMSSHKQIVMTCDVAPKDLQGCEERLTGRFQQGMVVEIESPSYETRLAILKSKVQATQKIIPEEILDYIAENIRSHVRAIEGALARIVMFMDINSDIPLTVEIAKNLLKNSIEEETTIKNLSINEILQTVGTFYGVTLADILSTQRTQTLVTPRQVAMFLSRKLTTKSLPEIGEAFGKSHATVYHGNQTIQRRLDVEPDLKKAIGEIASLLGRKPSDVLE